MIEENNFVVYCLVSPSNRFYVGQTKDIHRRLREYRRASSIHQRKLNNCLKKYGLNNFRLAILERCSTQEELDKLETMWINLLQSNSKENLNLLSGGGGFKRHTAESKKLMSLSSSGKLNPMYGKTHSLKAKLKISESHKGRKASLDERKRLSLLHKDKPKTEVQRKRMAISKCVYTYIITSPNNEVYQTRNLSQFCREYKISEWGLGEVARNKKDNFKGWRLTRVKN